MINNSFDNLLDKFENMLISGKQAYFDAEEFDDVIEYYDKIDLLEKAKYILDIAFEMHPKNELLILRKARFMMYDHNFSETIKYLDQYFHSYEFDLYLLKIECYLSLKLYDKANYLINEMLEDKENDKDLILSELGYIFIETGNIIEGIKYLEKSLLYNNENEEVLIELVNSYELENNHERAIDYCIQLLDLDPYNADEWLLLGKLYSLQKNYFKALDSFEFYSTIIEDNISSLRLKAHCLILLNKTEEAINILSQCINLEPKDDLLYLSLVDCYINQNQYQKVIESINSYEALIETPNIILSAKRAYANLKLGNTTLAREGIENARRISPSNYEINIIALDIYLELQVYDKALSICNDIISEDKENLSVLEKAIKIYLKFKDYKNAFLLRKKILQISESKKDSI